MTDGVAPKFSPKKRQKMTHGLTLQVYRYAECASYINGSFDPAEACFLLALTDSGRPSPLFQLGSKYLPEYVKTNTLEGFSKTLDELEQMDQVHCRAEMSSPWHFGIYTVASNVSSAMYFLSEFLIWRYQQPDLATAVPTLQVVKYCDVNLQEWMEACTLKVEMTQVEFELQKALECVPPSYAGHLKVCAQFVSSREVVITLHGSSYYLKDEFARWQGFYVTRSGVEMAQKETGAAYARRSPRLLVERGLDMVLKPLKEIVVKEIEVTLAAGVAVPATTTAELKSMLV